MRKFVIHAASVITGLTITQLIVAGEIGEKSERGFLFGAGLGLLYESLKK